MFDRLAYKTAAKGNLKGHWKVPILITLIIGGINLLMSLPSAVQPDSAMPIILNILAVIISGILLIAETAYFLQFIRNPSDAPFNTFLEALNKWKEGILGMLWFVLWVWLWALLFLIPGIVKAFAYSQMFFIIAENPGITVRKAMKMSMAMTKGYKGDLFVLDLSFLGWGLLCIPTLGIGLLWLIPYIRASQTHAYAYLKRQALTAGVLNESDFTGR
ncbi:DUF975 family protein [Treponema brennaborense]|uniref:Integral membrane protein n=1 Tax=Treponema brennaborense (strain DSM 12168 / CIP 105900 / DD5/3) TaxID=906968 RepID=F4LPZ2_TREBD|nr:DUF975 family protein [Treponema brennaborense]AEE16084.1 protein of unknown function DUF975 [Treponema brennaborense DSM 12168]